MDSDDELAEQVEALEVDAEQGPTIISLSIDMYTSKTTGLHNSTVVIDPYNNYYCSARTSWLQLNRH